MKKIVLTCVLVFFSLLCDPVCTKGQKRKGNSENRMLLRGLYLPQV